MKKVLLALACALPFGVVAADEAPLLAATGSTALVQMSETELDTVVGGRRGGDVCFFCWNTAVVTQLNISLGSLGVSQRNYSNIRQTIN